MLVLTRRRGESILIGGNIEIIVLDNTARQVKIGINAPREIEIVRSELLQRENGGKK